MCIRDRLEEGHGSRTGSGPFSGAAGRSGSSTPKVLGRPEVSEVAIVFRLRECPGRITSVYTEGAQARAHARPDRHPDRPDTGDAVPAETHVEKGPLDRQQVLELIRDLLADILEIEPSAISESSSFAEDLLAVERTLFHMGLCGH